MRSLHAPQARWEPVLAMVLLAALLTIGQHRARVAGEVSLGERAAQRVVWAVESVLVTLGSVVGNLKTAALEGGALARENEDLRRQVADLQAEKNMLLGYYHENKALKAKLGWDGTGVPDGIPARVIDWSSDPRRKRITIEASRELERGNIVRTAAGLIGRVIEAQGTRGVVVLLVDGDHAVAARVLRQNGDQGIVYAAPPTGDAIGMLMLKVFEGPADVRAGDVVVSSGMGGVYPAGLPIGVVQRVERSAVGVSAIVAYLRPFADFDHLDFVRVIRQGG